MTQPALFGEFTTAAIDPPWALGDSLPGETRGAARHYDLLDVDGIAGAYDLPNMMMPDARLFVWRLASMQREALELIENRWGFVVKAQIVWVKTYAASGKVHFGMGRQTRNSHETALIATRGNPPRLSASVRSVFEADEPEPAEPSLVFKAPYTEHSRKPELFFHHVEALSPGPYVELFAREHRGGWASFGKELEAS